MIGIERIPVIVPHLAALLMLAVALPDVVFAQDGAAGTPKTAEERRHGNGWELGYGVREIQGACSAVLAPADANSTSTLYGRGRECRLGYRKVEDACVMVEVSATSTVESWQHDRGYLEVNQACAADSVPLNGYLRNCSYGAGGESDQAHHAVSSTCAAISMPSNAFLATGPHG